MWEPDGTRNNESLESRGEQALGPKITKIFGNDAVSENLLLLSLLLKKKLNAYPISQAPIYIVISEYKVIQKYLYYIDSPIGERGQLILNLGFGDFFVTKKFPKQVFIEFYWMVVGKYHFHKCV